MQAYLITNTGSPQTPTTADVRTYLTDFLTDPAIMGMPYLIRQMVVRWLIVPRRAPKSAERYRHIWLPEGSPLQVYARQLAREMEQLSGKRVYVAMRYERRTVSAALRQAASEGVTELISQPLFPHYASSSFGSMEAFIRREYDRLRPPFRLVERGPFYDHPLFIRALAEQVAAAGLSPGTHLIVSYHGLPLSQVKPFVGDLPHDYPAQCSRTTELLLQEQEVRAVVGSHEQVYQSRFGHHWLTPELTKRLKALPSEGVKRVAVICPAFVADCLETVEEVGLGARDLFLDSGGQDFTLIPCPNASPTLARALV